MDPLHIAVLETISELGEVSLDDLLNERVYTYSSVSFGEPRRLLKGISAAFSLMTHARDCLLSFGAIRETHNHQMYRTYALTIKGKAFLLQRKLEESARKGGEVTKT